MPLVAGLPTAIGAGLQRAARSAPPSGLVLTFAPANKPPATAGRLELNFPGAG